MSLSGELFLPNACQTRKCNLVLSFHSVSIVIGIQFVLNNLILLTKHLFLICHNVCCLVSSPPPSKLDNSREVTSGGNGPHVHAEFCQYAGHMSSYVDYRECPAVSSSHEGHADICQLFAVSSNPIFILCKRITEFTQNFPIQNLKKTSLVNALLFLAPFLSGSRVAGVQTAPSVRYPMTRT